MHYYKIMKNCPLCNDIYSNWNLHKDQCLQKQLMQKETISFVYFRNLSYCKNCSKILEVAQVEYHRKTCKRNLRKAKTTSASLRNYIVPSLQNSINNDNQSLLPTNYQQIQQSLLKISQETLKIFLSNWLKNTQHIDPTVLSKIISNELHDICIKMENNIPNVSMEALNKKYKGKISDIIKRTKDIFDVQKIQPLIEKSDMSRKLKQELINQLNQFLSICKWEKKYKKIQKQVIQTRDRIILLYRELIVFVLQLFKTGMRKRIHLGLDLLIIFHSGQRFPSSQKIVEQNIQKIMRSNKNYIIIQKTTKTGIKDHLFISNRLKQLLKKFKWKGFLLSDWQVGRLSQFFNFSAISLRRGFFIQIVNFVKRSNPEIFTSHKSTKVADIYIQQLILKEKLCFHQSLKIPTSVQQLTQINSFDLVNKVRPLIQNPCIFDEDEQIIWQKFDFQINQSSIDHQLTLPPQIQLGIEQDDDKRLLIRQNSINIDKNNVQSTQIFTINGSQIKRYDFKFDYSDNFCQAKQSKNMCIYCWQQYNQLPMFCNCMKFNKLNLGVTYTKYVQTADQQLRMPSQYLQNQELFNQVRFFLHKRGGYVSNVSVSKNQVNISQIQNIPKQIRLQYYQQYIEGKYFPPLMIMKSGEDNINGSGVGLFAISQIESNVFLGEYGGDILTYQQSILTKRSDTLMDLTSKNKLQIGTIFHSSYVQLINTSKQGNCVAKKYTISGKLIIIIYSQRKIDIGQELLYNYTGNFKTVFSSNLQRYNFSQIEKNTTSITKQSQIYSINRSNIQQKNLSKNEGNIKKLKGKKLIESFDKIPIYQPIKIKTQKLKIQPINSKIQNIRKYQVEIRTNTCYAESLLVVYRYFFEYFADKESQVAGEIQKKRMDPFRFVSMFYQFKKNQGKQNEQQDIMQFYYFLEQKILKNDSPFHEMTVSENRKCLKCFKLENRFMSEKQWYCDIADNNNLLSLQTFSQVEVKCPICQKNTNHSFIKRLQSTPQLLILTFKRNGSFESNTKLKYKVNLKSLESHKGFQYELEVGVIHIGQSTNSGHYIVTFPKLSLAFDRNRIIQSYQDYSADIYMAIYVKKFPYTAKLPNKNQILQNVGIDVNIVEKLEQNIQKSYKIASIVKLITYLACEQIRCKFNISLDQTFVIPQTQVYGLNTVLTQNQQVSLKKLYQLTLISSSADAAASLAIIFGHLLMKKNLELKNYDPQQIFVSYMTNYCRDKINMMNTFIKDACGLKPNFSTIVDLKLLMEFIAQKSDLLQILRQPFVMFKNQSLQNTNQLSNLCVGKTGTNKNNSFCFAGLYESKPLICLNFKTKKSMFNFIEDQFKSLKLRKISV